MGQRSLDPVLVATGWDEKHHGQVASTITGQMQRHKIDDILVFHNKTLQKEMFHADSVK